ncbi:PREDICTED: collagen alpha-1(I) chain-like [Pseudopodoces humilis]|uniref:collagen alpha-1(I) chain-like n=1 Tax=Pseudopodoces humilis TaxID=181119 RepID=UPI00039572EB|nr:PREDICTED: collagen alpha-1(I) chain-like [Pseudopodoces humilis]
MSRSAPRSAPAAGTSLPSAPGGGGAEASSRSTMAGSACRFFAPRISAALGGGRERRRSAAGPARPPCRARGHPRLPLRTPGPGAAGGGTAERGPDGPLAPLAPPAPALARLRGACV